MGTRYDGFREAVRLDNSAYRRDVPDNAAPRYGTVRLAFGYIVAEIIAKLGVSAEKMFKLVDVQDEMADNSAAGEEQEWHTGGEE